MSRTPNVLVIVLDCVRASDFPGVRPGVDGMPATKALQKEFVAFPRAVSPATWTLPSHVSLLSGENLWEHGVHGKGRSTLPSGLPGIAPMLRRLGYRCLLASVNPFVSPDWGFGEGFDTVDWGGGYGLYLRAGGSVVPPFSSAPNEPARDALSRFRGSRWTGPATQYLPETVGRFPWVWDASIRMARHLRGRTEAPPVVGSWLEPTVERWLGGQASDRPVFALLNLLDAHEPYLMAPGRPVSFSEWTRFATSRADRRGWMYGSWHPSRRQLAVLHALYVEAIRMLDARIGRIVRAFQATGRWDDTICVITSDHGQAFGESGHLFHGFRAFEPLVRVPLWVHWPNGDRGGSRARGWASLIDVAPTVAEAVGEPMAEFPEAVSLSSLVVNDRPGPVCAVGDGSQWGRWADLPADRKALLDRVEVAAFEGSTKTVVEKGRVGARAWELDEEGYERSSEPRELAEGGATIADLRSKLERLTAGPVAKLSVDVGERLTGWGY